MDSFVLMCLVHYVLQKKPKPRGLQMERGIRNN